MLPVPGRRGRARYVLPFAANLPIFPRLQQSLHVGDTKRHGITGMNWDFHRLFTMSAAICTSRAM
jgi:hypothetical protein